MKVAICSVQEFNPTIGGIERVSVSVGRELLKRGIDVIFIACQKSPYSKEYKLPAVQHFLPEAKDYSEANVEAFVNIVNKENVDILLNQNAHSYLYNKMCYEVKTRTGKPLVSEFHFCPDMRKRGKQNMLDRRFFTLAENLKNLAYDIATRWPFTIITMRDQKRLFSHMYEVSDKVVLLSDKFYDSFLSIGGLKDHAKLAYVNNMLSFEHTEGVDMTLKKKEFVFVGRFSPQKNPYRVLYIWEKLQAKLPDWKVVMVGNGPWFEKVKNLAFRMHLRDISFVGFASPAGYYKRGAIAWVTSNYEGWPLVLTEAMQYGCVPIAFESFDSIRDIITDGTNGKLVHCFDIDEFAQKCYALATDGTLPAYAQAANKAMAKLQPEVIVEQWIGIFNELKK